MALDLALEESSSLLYGPIARRRFSRTADAPMPSGLTPARGAAVAVGDQVKMKYPGGEILAAVVIKVLPTDDDAPTWVKVTIKETGHRLEGRSTDWLKADQFLLADRPSV